MSESTRDPHGPSFINFKIKFIQQDIERSIDSFARAVWAFRTRYRKNFFCNACLLSLAIVLSFLDIAILYSNWLLGTAYIEVNFFDFSLTGLFFIFLYFLFRRNKKALACYSLIFCYFAAVIYALRVWGADVPTALLGHSLLIVIAGIFINIGLGFWAAFIAIAGVYALGYLQFMHVLAAYSSWNYQSFDMLSDGLPYLLVFMAVAVIFWLCNREIEKLLKRGRASEAELQQERDLREMKIQDRTKELRLGQLREIAELSRSAEIGRVASGLFHDLVSPLTAVSLHIEKLQGALSGQVTEARQALDEAFIASKRMEKFIGVLRKRIKKDVIEEIFFLEQEVREAIVVLNYLAVKNKVRIDFSFSDSIAAYNSSARFYQIVTNLLCNAIESYEGAEGQGVRQVKIKLSKNGNQAVLTVEDWGVGIMPEQREKIFEPFFTTKAGEKNLGIGLATVKHIVEKEFGGTVEILPTDNSGTQFRVVLAIGNPPIFQEESGPL